MVNEQSPKNPRVIIVRNPDVKKAVFSALDNIDFPNLNGKNILLKPNVGREVGPRLAINTNPDVVKAVFEYLNEKFDATFFLGDSPIIMTDTKKAFIQSGYQQLMEHPNIQWIDLDRPDPITIPIPQAKIQKKIRLTGYFHKFDFIISIPVLKMHMHTGATLSFKNMKGLIYKRDKVKLHHYEYPEIINPLREEIPFIKELDVAIADLSHVMKPHMAIIDATYCMEGLGPSAGTVRKADMIIASLDFLAADVVALKIARPDWTLKNVPHLHLISQYLNPQNPLSFEDIETIPENIENYILNLEPPPVKLSLKYSNIDFHSEHSCSSCLSTVFLFLKNNIDVLNEYFDEKHPLRIVIGKGNKDLDDYEYTLLVGNCTAHLRKKGIYIKGCPPVQSKIVENLTNLLKQKQIFKIEKNAKFHID